MSPAIELTAFRGQPVWEILAALYLAMVQAGAFALLTGAWSQALGRKNTLGLAPYATLAGAALALCAPVCLVAEMLAPWRFPTLFWRFTPTSPLSWGVIALSLLAALGLARVVGVVRGGRFATPWSARVTALAALGVLAYTTAEVGLVAGVPLWKNPVGLALGLGASLSAGLVLALVTARLCGRPAWRPLPRALAGVAAAASGLALLVWGLLGGWPSMPGWGRGALLLGGSGVLLFSGGVLLVRPGEKGFSLSATFVLAGDLGARLGLVLAGQAASLGRNLGEPTLLGHTPWLAAVAPVALAAALICLAGLGLARRSQAWETAPAPDSSQGPQGAGGASETPPSDVPPDFGPAPGPGQGRVPSRPQFQSDTAGRSPEDGFDDDANAASARAPDPARGDAQAMTPGQPRDNADTNSKRDDVDNGAHRDAFDKGANRDDLDKDATRANAPQGDTP